MYVLLRGGEWIFLKDSVYICSSVLDILQFFLGVLRRGQTEQLLNLSLDVTDGWTGASAAKNERMRGRDRLKMKALKTTFL